MLKNALIAAIIATVVASPVAAKTTKHHKHFYNVREMRAKQVVTPTMAAAKACSLEADRRHLHGEPRAKFRDVCKAKALKK